MGHKYKQPNIEVTGVPEKERAENMMKTIATYPGNSANPQHQKYEGNYTKAYHDYKKCKSNSADKCSIFNK